MADLLAKIGHPPPPPPPPPRNIVCTRAVDSFNEDAQLHREPLPDVGSWVHIFRKFMVSIFHTARAHES